MGWSRTPAPEITVEYTKHASPIRKIEPREDLVSLDFETYYSQDFTLSKLSYTEYITSPQFEVIMCGVKVGTGPTIVHDAKTLKKKLKKIDWTKHDLLCHNTPFDGFILSHKYGVFPRRYFDTLSMARGLHGNDTRADLDTLSQFYGGRGKIKGVLDDVKGMHVDDIKKAKKNEQLWEEMKIYCANDVDEMHRIFYRMMAIIPETELEKIHIFINMFCNPVLRVDRKRVKVELAREIEEKERKLLTAVGTKQEQAKLIQLLGRTEALNHARKEIGSSVKFAEMLEACGVVPPQKISPTTGKLIPAFSKSDEEFLGLLEHHNSQVRDLVEARLSVKSTTNETRAERFLKVSENDRPLPVLVQYYGAHTGRPSGGNKMNMLNLVRGGELRRSILAPKGYKVNVADSGQIEARVLDWLAGDTDGLEEFKLSDQKLDRDPYCKLADDIYGYTIDKDQNPDERHVGKVVRLGLGYQMGPPKLQTTLALGALGGKPMFIDLAEAQRIVGIYRRKKLRVVRFWDIANSIIRDMVRGREGEWKCLHWEKERVWLPNGMCLKYPGIKERQHETGVDWFYLRKGEEAKIYGGLLTENLVQALANVIITEQMVKAASKWRLVTMTYDELVTISPDDRAKECQTELMQIMATPPEWCQDLPLKAEGGFADNYSK
jgi:DNA polymerase